MFKHLSSLTPDRPSSFSLDTAGVASLLGGDDAASALTTVHVYGNRRLLGCYNTPGSFQIARRLNSFAKSASFCNIASGTADSIHNSVQLDPTTLFEMEGMKGPKYRAAHSGTIIEETGYLGALFMKECAAWESEGKVVPGRRTQPISITIADLGRRPVPRMRAARSSASDLFAFVPIITSVGTCVTCAVYRDWYASSLIFSGIVASGLSGLVLGLADFVFALPEPVKGSPAGGGILTCDKDIILLKGSEGAVNSITRGKFSLRFRNEGHFKLIRLCSMLFFVQFLTQLFFIHHASTLGQTMFFASLVVSAIYNACVSSSGNEQIHRKILFDRVLEKPLLTKYTFGTRTTAVVFILLVLRPPDPTGLLNELLPDNTKVWTQWKTTILQWLRHPSDQMFGLGGSLDGFTQQDKDLLGLLYEDACAAYRGYTSYVRTINCGV